MKKPIYLLLVAALAIFVTSCDETIEPDFDYTIEENTVTFENLTKGDASEYTWSFGDGNTSADKNPTHTYDKGGDYLVSLIAQSSSGAKEKTKTITIEGGGDGAVTLPTVPGADALMVAINNTTFTQQAGLSIEINVGLAASVFFDAAGTAYVDAGDVTINGMALDKNESNYYTYTSTSGEEFKNPVAWKASGSGEFDAFDKSINLDFPSMSEITSGDITAGADYNLTFKSAITNADSVIIVLSDGGSTYQKIVPNNNTNTYTVDGSDLSSFTASENGLISISAYQYVLEEVGTKKIAFVNQGNVTKTVAVK